MTPLFLGIISFFASLLVYFVSFKYPSLLVFTSIFVNVLTLAVFLYKFGDLHLLNVSKVI